jgi:hypothetical protein
VAIFSVHEFPIHCVVKFGGNLISWNTATQLEKRRYFQFIVVKIYCRGNLISWNTATQSKDIYRRSDQLEYRHTIGKVAVFTVHKFNFHFFLLKFGGYLISWNTAVQLAKRLYFETIEILFIVVKM